VCSFNGPDLVSFW